jgi:DNA repair exonuclease SbcCD ATPase subunit
MTTGKHPHYRISITPDPQQEQTVSEEPKETGASEVDPGEGWRLLGPSELVQEGDERRHPNESFEWSPTINHRSDSEIDGQPTNGRQSPGLIYRRRIPAPQPAEQVPSVDIVRHEREELRKANAELLERFKDAEHERDLYKKQFTHALHCVNTAFQDDYKDGCILPDYLRLGDCKFTGVIRLAKDFQRLQDERDQLAVRCKDLEKEIEIEDAANQKALKSVMNERDQLAARCKEYQEQLQDFDRMRGERDIYKRELATAKADAMKLINRNSLSIYDYNELVKRYF